MSDGPVQRDGEGAEDARAGAGAGDEREDAGPRRGGLGRTIAIGLAGLILPAIGLVLLGRSCDRGAVGGELTVTGEPSWRAALARCHTGELAGFDGVELARDSDGAVMVRAIADDDRGPSLELAPPTGGPPIRIGRDACPGLKVELRPRATDSEGAAIVDGRVVAHCPRPGGGAVRLDAWWRRCGPR